jgi:hypothetical protein
MEQNLPLNKIQHWKKFLEETDLFDTEFAIGWFIRRNQRELVEAGAIIKVRNQWCMVRPKFDEVFIQICQARAAESIENARVY